jgi:uncharacterized protein YijF (DUF1287 family)
MPRALKAIRVRTCLLLAVVASAACSGSLQHHGGSNPSRAVERPAIDNITSEPVRRVLDSARNQLTQTNNYTQDYRAMPYPGGDMPADTGACTDVVIRAFRNAGVDLQKEVHEDMAANFSAYPQKWGLNQTDTNIDHRRVPNLQTYFTRKGTSVQISADGNTYQPGDVVTWDLNGKGMTHIGLVSNKWDEDTKRYLVIHNIGGGVQEEDRLFEWKITGHYRYFQ